MLKYRRVEKPFLPPLAALGRTVIEQGLVFSDAGVVHA